jgi:RNA polymerase sigma factor (TIGR02999 family)
MVDGEGPKAVSATGKSDRNSADRLFSCLYNELHRLAVRELRRNSPASLSPTALLHETYLNVSQRKSADFTDRPRFMTYAARAMRGLIIDHLRRAKRQKHGGDFEVVSLSDELPICHAGDIEVETLREALDELAAIDQRLARCVDLRFFCGLGVRDIAQLWNVSERTVLRDWDEARILLSRLITGVQADSTEHP